jgi:hypothetical protein
VIILSHGTVFIYYKKWEYWHGLQKILLNKL